MLDFNVVVIDVVVIDCWEKELEKKNDGRLEDRALYPMPLPGILYPAFRVHESLFPSTVPYGQTEGVVKAY